MTLRAIVCLTFVLVAAPATAERPRFHDVDGGWHEAWIGVSDLARMRSYFESVAGWRVVAKGRIENSTLRYIAPEAKGGRFFVMAPPDYPQGWVRLIALDGGDRAIIRRHAQAWDTGAIFSMMMRTADLECNLQDAERLGWTAYNVPYHFGFGDLKLANAVMRGPDGVNIAAYEWITPKRDDVRPGALSKAFNSMQMVADLDRSVAFYEALGFRTIQRGRFIDDEEKPTNFGLPVNFATTIPRNYAIMIPEKGDAEAGRVELMQFEGLRGRDLSAEARLDGLGIATLLFPVSDLGAIERRLEKAGAKIIRSRTLIDLQPFGRAEATTAAAPEGALLTFFEPLAR
jgi:catechol 2,3-dioxygenase-like lactoylglutathione lyase family enzyme